VGLSADLRALSPPKQSDNLVAALAQHVEHGRSIFRQLVVDTVAIKAQDTVPARVFAARSAHDASAKESIGWSAVRNFVPND
jgi:hypothetical protein